MTSKQAVSRADAARRRWDQKVDQYISGAAAFWNVAGRRGGEQGRQPQPPAVKSGRGVCVHAAGV